MSSHKQIEGGKSEAKSNRVLVGKSGSMCISSCPTDELFVLSRGKDEFMPWME